MRHWPQKRHSDISMWTRRTDIRQKSWEFLFHLWNNEENIWKKSKREQNGEAEEIRNKGYCTMSKLLGPKIISYKLTWMSWLWEARELFYAPTELAEKRKMKKPNKKRLDESFRRVRVLVKLSGKFELLFKYFFLVTASGVARELWYIALESSWLARVVELLWPDSPYSWIYRCSAIGRDSPMKPWKISCLLLEK